MLSSLLRSHATFTEQVEAAVEALSSDPAQPMDEKLEFIDASRLVCDGIRDIRKRC